MPNYWADKIEPDLCITLEQAPALAYALSDMATPPGCDCCPFGKVDNLLRKHYPERDYWNCSLQGGASVVGWDTSCNTDMWLRRARNELAEIVNSYRTLKADIVALEGKMKAEAFSLGIADIVDELQEMRKRADRKAE